MADAVTSQTIQDGERVAVLKFTNESDGTGESSVKKVDVSALTTNSAGESCTSVSLARIYWATRGMGVDIEFDATTNVLAIPLPADSLTSNVKSPDKLLDHALVSSLRALKIEPLPTKITPPEGG